MPAVSVCDPLARAMHHNLDVAGQSKSSDDLNITGLTGGASRILCSELDYEETDNYRQTVQDHLKNKYIVLSLPKQENSSSGDKTTTTDVGAGSSSSGGTKTTGSAKEPRLPEPKVVLYAPDRISLGWAKDFPVGAGMLNVGNTCYLNSTLQALFHVPALVNWLLTDTHHKSKCSEGIDRHRFISDGAGECLTCAVAKTLTASHQKSGEVIRPFLVYDKLKIICRTLVHGQQEDAHEFLRYLLEGMEKAYLSRHKATKLDSYSKETTPINQIFGGYIRTEVKCLQCGHISTTFQHFQDLLLDIRKANTIDEALAGYFGREMLDNNDYKCESCKRRVPACKQFTLERPPKVLCLQLKRFSVMGGKISRHVSFKQTIDMGPHIRRKPGEPISKVIYKLTSMVTHMGPSVNCGHYTAIAQVSSGKFFSFDDSSVRQVSLNSVTSTNAYIMIFEMEPSSIANGQALNSQLSSSKGEISLSKSPSSSLSSYSHSNGVSSSKLLDHGSGSLSRALTPSRNGEGSSSSSLSASTRLALSSRPLSSYTSSYGSRSLTRDSSLNRITSTPPSPPLTSLSHLTLPLSSSVRRSYHLSSQPSSSYLEKNRLNETSKSGKLVDYDGDSSEDEDKTSHSTLKKFRDEQEPQKFSGNNGSSSPRSSNKSNGNSHAYSPRRATSRSPTSSNHNSNNHHHNYAPSNGMDSVSANGNGNRNGRSSSSNGSSSRGSSPKNVINNGKAEHSNGSSDKSKDKWHSSKSRTNSPDRKTYAKTSAGLNKGWQVSKESSPPSSTATANGWDDSHSCSSRSNNRSMTPNTADSRSYNGNNRSESTSHLQKTSLYGYGNMGVLSWDGGKARLDREIDSDRRQEIVKRRYDDDDDEYDRGRTKKIKVHHNDHNNRGNDSRYNRFQEFENNKWKYPNSNNNNNYYRYNNQSYHRPRHGGNHNRSNHSRRFNHNKSRSHWRR
ncbi:ubiquitin carboxyl-terminal hydrolase 36 isoform X3 [Copidosoma floridanum]|uniref:ubiquitin carboxyl-terminal hydrolase 36 isoform X3 n=1 Tax=Copidosoma floridanum TaxID=29053 RepID=UPI0006C95805|nr:ubiquitin carboxyl-terminal hydrolase 36 isoform X3 [Copidosoma floridanum]